MDLTRKVSGIKLPELLAPAGNMQSFLAAVESGADAVYVGAKEFSARQYAENFNDKELASAVKYAHLRGVNVYLALNTLILDHEFSKALEVIYRACTNDIDAVIIQDIGLADQAAKLIPGIRLHASTQMTVHNFEGVNLLKKMGFKRVVLARELTLEQITDIVRMASGIEIETFIHGALCVSYSGQCLFSSMIGGRSGNRGRCAQPCRQRYRFIDTSSGHEVYDGSQANYLLSTKDLCTVGILPEIVKAGVHSLKIEGRMKSPEYVATVTRIYRKYLDFIGSDRQYTVKDDDIKDLKSVFNRGGFTKGFIGGDNKLNLMSTDTPSHKGVVCGKVIGFDERARMVDIKLETALRHGDVIKSNPESDDRTTVTKILSDGEKVKYGSAGAVVKIQTSQFWSKGDVVYKVYDKKLMEKAETSYSGKLYKKVPLYAEFFLGFGKPVQLVVWDDEGNKVEAAGKKPAEGAKKTVLTPERVLDQLESMGNTPFYLARAEIHMEDELFLPVSEINSVRRKAVEAIGEERIRRRVNRCEDEKVFREQLNVISRDAGEIRTESNKPGISVFVPNIELLEQSNLQNVSRIYIPAAQFYSDRVIPGVIEDINRKGTEVFIAFPRITDRPEMERIYHSIKKIEDCGFAGALIGNLGLVKIFKILKNFKIHADYSFNLLNRFSAESLQRLGLDGITISPELELKQLQKVISGTSIESEIMVHGRIPLMTSRYCFAGDILHGCGAAGEESRTCRKQDYGLKDKTGAVFPILFDPECCRFDILNSKVLCLAWDFEEIKKLGARHIRVDLTHEKKENIRETINLYSRLLEEGDEVLDKYREILEDIKQRGFTRGHYFRGVE